MSGDETTVTRSTDVERFWGHVTVAEGACWTWARGCDSSGYGLFWHNRRHVKAHRFAWEISNGPIPGSLLVCHHCDNPPCCNPAHLFLGTLTDNMRDKSNKGRHPNTNKTGCPSGHAYDAANTYVNRRGSRECRECHRAANRAYRASRAA